MTLCFFLKLLSELSLYYVVANCLMSVALTGIESLIPLLICAAVGALGFWMDEKYSSKRLYILPLLLTVLFFAKGFGTGLALMLPVLYVGLLIHGRRYYMDHDTFADFFRNSMMVAAFLSIPFVLLMKLDYIAPFIILFLLSGIFMMRLLRQDAEIFNEKKFRILNLLSVLSILVVTLLLGSDAFLNWAGAVLGNLYELLLSPVIYLVAFTLTQTALMLFKLFKFIFPEYQVNTEGMKFLEDFMIQEEYVETEGYDPGTMSDTLVMLAKGAAILLGVLFVVIYVYRTQKGRNKKEEGSIREARSSVKNFRPEEKIYSDIVAPREPRAAVRYHYRNFLRLCLKLGHEFPRHYTSKYIENVVSHQFDENTLKTMRQTYIRARYSDHDITKEDVSAMKAQVKSLRENVSGVLDDLDHSKETR